MIINQNQTAGKVATLANAPYQQQPQESSSMLEAQLLQMQQQRKLAEAMMNRGYVPNSGALGALIMIVNAYKGSKLAKNADEKVADYTKRLLDSTRAEEAAKAAAIRAESDRVYNRSLEDKNKEMSIVDVPDPNNPDNIISVRKDRFGNITPINYGGSQSNTPDIQSGDTVIHQSASNEKDAISQTIAQIEQGIGHPLTPEQKNQVASGNFNINQNGSQPMQPVQKTPQGQEWGVSRPRYKPDSSMGLNPEESLSPDSKETLIADYILHGRMPALGMRANKARAEVSAGVNRVAKDLGISVGELLMSAPEVKASAGSMLTLQKQSDAMELAQRKFIENAKIMNSVSDKVSRTGVPAFNKLLLSVKTNALGDVDSVSLAAARDVVAQEYAKIASNATGAAGSTDTAMLHARDLIDSAQTPDQLKGAINVLTRDIEAQFETNKVQMSIIKDRLKTVGKRASGILGNAQPSNGGAPVVGDIVDGMRYLGGNPASQASWGNP